MWGETEALNLFDNIQQSFPEEIRSNLDLLEWHMSGPDISTKGLKIKEEESSGFSISGTVKRWYTFTAPDMNVTSSDDISSLKRNSVSFNISSFELPIKYLDELKSSFNKAGDNILGKIYSVDDGFIYLVKGVDAEAFITQSYKFDYNEDVQNDDINVEDLTIYIPVDVYTRDEFYSTGPGAQTNKLDQMCISGDINGVKQVAESFNIPLYKDKDEKAKYLSSLSHDQLISMIPESRRINSYSDMGKLFKKLVKGYNNNYSRKNLVDLALIINNKIFGNSAIEDDSRQIYFELAKKINQGETLKYPEDMMYRLIRDKILMGETTAWPIIRNEDIPVMTDDALIGFMIMFSDYHGRNGTYFGHSKAFIELMKELGFYYFNDDRMRESLSSGNFERDIGELCYHTKRAIIMAKRS